MTGEFAQQYPTLDEFIGNGAELKVNSGGYARQVAVLCEGRNIICQFPSGMLSAEEIFVKLEQAARKYMDEGTVIDEINT